MKRITWAVVFSSSVLTLCLIGWGVMRALS
jgi:hypothetical protein